MKVSLPFQIYFENKRHGEAFPAQLDCLSLPQRISALKRSPKALISDHRTDHSLYHDVEVFPDGRVCSGGTIVQHAGQNLLRRKILQLAVVLQD